MLYLIYKITCYCAEPVTVKLFCFVPNALSVKVQYLTCHHGFLLIVRVGVVQCRINSHSNLCFGFALFSKFCFH